MSSTVTTLEVPNVDLGEDTELFRKLFMIWMEKRPRNITRSVYFDGHAALKDFGIAIPPKMAGIPATLGWTQRGVRAVTDRSVFEGFISPEGSDDPFGLNEILQQNRFNVEFPAACVSSAIHGCSFISAHRGDVRSGEPEILITSHPADMSAGLWDYRRRELAGFIAVTSVDFYDRPDQVVLATPFRWWTMDRSEGGWKAEPVEHGVGHVPVAPLSYQYELKRPLGHSRITRASMYYTDAAIRTIARSEVSSEFYSAVEYWLFGSDVSSFVGNDRWSAVMGRIKALDIEDGEDKPDLHRFNGASPQPHIEQLRMWSQLFAEDQDLEVKMADSKNPTSADAIYAAKEGLITTTRDANTLWGHGAVQAMQLAVMLRDGADKWSGFNLSARFTDPAIVSPSARADAFSKLSTAIPGFSTSTVGLEFAGLSREQIARFQADQRRASGAGTVAQILAKVKGAADGGNIQPGAVDPGRPDGSGGASPQGSGAGMGGA